MFWIYQKLLFLNIQQFHPQYALLITVIRNFISPIKDSLLSALFLSLITLRKIILTEIF